MDGTASLHPDPDGSPEQKVSLRDATICHEGVLLHGQHLNISRSTGLILSSSIDVSCARQDAEESGREEAQPDSIVELEDGDTVAPGLIELQTNGLSGIHFTTLIEDNHVSSLEKVAMEMAKNGVTAWYATIPTVEDFRWKQVSRCSFPYVLEVADIMSA